MEVIKTVKQMQERAGRVRRQGKRIALVPTMGYLHEGHLSLMREGKKRSDDLVVSIFVNPTQFGPGEDLEAYPRNLARDLELVQKEGGDAVFTPNTGELYPERFQTYVKLRELPNHLCGISRPVHFEGVATVVTKLFNIVKPHVAIFGRKDYQQLKVIERLVRDLNLEVEIIGAPIIRESDGLAMSSRNAYLSAEQRPSALALYESLIKAKALLESGERGASTIIDAAAALITSRPATSIDYIAICDPETLDDVTTIDRPALMALAVKVGATRLIDNMILEP